MYGLLAVTVVLLVGAVAGDNACSKAEMDAGVRFRPHPDFCDLYLQCSSGYVAVPRACGSGLLYDTIAKTCVYPNQAKCYNNPAGICTGGLYRTSCCNTYIDCTNGNDNKKLVQCPVGQVFSGAGCTPIGTTTCEDNAVCTSPVSRTAAPPSYLPSPIPCRRRPVGDKCKYDELLADNTTIMHRSCGAGTAYNATACDCSSVDSDCVPPPFLINKIMDPQCRASLVLEFQDPPVSYTDKDNAGRQLNPFSIMAYGYSSNGGVSGQFRRGPNVDKTGLQIPYFAQNMIKAPFGIRITFQADSATPQNVVLVGNGADAVQDCESTLEITADNSGGRWIINVKAVGDQTGVLTGTVFSGSAASDVTVVVVYDGQYIKAYASSPGSRRVDLGQAMVGGEIKNNLCDLKIVYGLIGTLKEFTVHEACGDANLLNSL